MFTPTWTDTAFFLGAADDDEPAVAGTDVAAPVLLVDVPACGVPLLAAELHALTMRPHPTDRVRIALSRPGRERRELGFVTSLP
jgi:hypothetical protein